MFPMDMGLKDKVAVITGGSVGIGLAAAKALAKEGVHLLLCARDEPRVRQCAEEISAQYAVRAVGVSADVSKEADCASVVEAAEKMFGAVDILINNAGT